MGTILLVLSTTRDSQKTVDLALERAGREKAPLTVLFVLDSAMPESIFEKLTDMGFTGEKPSEQLRDAILVEYRERGRKKLAEIEALAAPLGIPCETVMREGEFRAECLSLIAEKGAELVILTRKRRSSLSRFIFGSPVEEIRERTGCELLIVEE